MWQTARTVEAVPCSAFEQALTEGRVAEVIIGLGLDQALAWAVESDARLHRRIQAPACAFKRARVFSISAFKALCDMGLET